jgi:diphosphomevalonate decarboxylase
MATSERRARARARANFALIKYWGKASGELNVPAVGSISITLDALWSETEVAFDAALATDDLVLDGARRAEQLAKVSRCLDVLRARAGVTARARVTSNNNFPTGAGLASSASGFAALVTAAATALDLELSPRELSIVARQGSGSAARSIFGGYVEMHAGAASDGSDSFAEPLLAPEAWPLEVVIAITATDEKAVGSRGGMLRSAQTSPYYAAWVATHRGDLDAARAAIASRDFATLAEVAEHNCLKMHSAAIAAQPPLLYWNGATVACVHAIRGLRERGVPVFFTIDAGPQVKAICEPSATAAVARTLRDVPGVLEVMTSTLGRGAELL